MSLETYELLMVGLRVAALFVLATAIFSFVLMILRWRTPQRRRHVVRLLLSIAAMPCMLGIHMAILWFAFFRPGLAINRLPRIDAEACCISIARPRLSDQINSATRNARLSGMRTLAILQGDAAEATNDLVDSLLDWDEHPEALAYVPLVISQKTIDTEAATLAESGWPLPSPGEVVLVALDGQAKQLGSERLTVTDAGTEKRIANLLEKFRPPVRDAQDLLAAAKEEAKRTDRKVWIQSNRAHAAAHAFGSRDGSTTNMGS